MRKIQNIKIIKRHSLESQPVAETLAEPVAAPKNERGLVETVKDWVREHQRRKLQAEQTARHLLNGFAPIADEI
jgi:hypothetical protein